MESAIVIDLDVMNGTPCFRGTRVPFRNLINSSKAGTRWESSCANSLR